MIKVIYKPNIETLEEGDTLPNLTEGKVYQATRSHKNPNYYLIVCDDGHIRPYYVEDFISLDNFRNSIYSTIKILLCLSSDFSK